MTKRPMLLAASVVVVTTGAISTFAWRRAAREREESERVRRDAERAALERARDEALELEERLKRAATDEERRELRRRYAPPSSRNPPPPQAGSCACASGDPLCACR